MHRLGMSLLVFWISGTGVAFAERGAAVERQADALVEQLNKTIDASAVRIAETLELSEIQTDSIKTLLVDDLSDVEKSLVRVKGLEQQLLNERRQLESQRDQAQQELGKLRESNEQLQDLHQDLERKYGAAQWWQSALGSGYLLAFAGLVLQFMMHRRSDKLNALQVEELSRKLRQQDQRTRESSEQRTAET